MALIQQHRRNIDCFSYRINFLYQHWLLVPIPIYLPCGTAMVTNHVGPGIGILHSLHGATLLELIDPYSLLSGAGEFRRIAGYMDR